MAVEGKGMEPNLYFRRLARQPLNRRDKDLITVRMAGSDGWMAGVCVVKYKVNYLTLWRYEEAHRRLNIDGKQGAHGEKMKGDGRCFRSGFSIMNSSLPLPPRIFPVRTYRAFSFFLSVVNGKGLIIQMITA